jgi:hypothetical protein
MATPWSRAQMGVTQVPTTTPILNDGTNTTVQSNRGMGAVVRLNMTPVISPRRCPCLYSSGVTTTVLPNPLSTQIWAHAPPILDGTKPHRSNVATTRWTSGRRSQKLDAHCILALQGKLLTSDKEEDSHAQGHLFVFLFHLFSFHLFTTIVTRAFPLRTIKGEAEATSRRGPIKNTTGWASTQTHAPPKRLRIYSLSRTLVTPTMSTLV